MKNIFFVFLALIFVTTVQASDSKKVNPNIKEVTVFLNRAQVTSTATVYIDAGTTEIIFEGLPSMIDPQSIQVAGKGEFIIMGVKHSLNYLDPQKKSHEIVALEDTIEVLQLQLDILKGTRDVYAKEEQMILANQSIKGENNGVSPDALEDMADFFRDRLSEIRTEILKDDLKIKKKSEVLNKFRNQLNEINRLRNQPTSNITVAISSKAPKNVQLELDYIVTNAGWYPLYDLRAKDTHSPVQMQYKAQVYQNTGMDWNNVKLKLSTANPSVGGTKPVLNPLYLNIYEEIAYRSQSYDGKAKSKKSAAYAPSMDAAGAAQMDYKYEEKDAETVANYTVVTETSIAAEFDIAIPYTIPTGGKEQLVDVQSHQLPATFRHSAVPKLDKDAFLMALVTGWEELNLLSGNANVYFEGTYVGQSYLDVQNTKDTLEFSLGRDKKVVIERKILKDYTSKKMIGTNRKEDYAYEIIVRNTKKDPIEITLEDQVPVTQNSQIEILDVETSGAQSYDTTTGKVIWKLNIDPAQTKSVVIKYSVKYPKNKRVSGL